MITPEQILEATEQDLPRMAGEVLFVHKNSHDRMLGTYHTINKTWMCRHCGDTFKQLDMSNYCEEANKIYLTPANAFKWKMWMRYNVESRHIRDSLIQWYLHETDVSFKDNSFHDILRWASYCYFRGGTIIDDIKLACLAKILSESKGE